MDQLPHQVRDACGPLEPKELNLYVPESVSSNVYSISPVVQFTDAERDTLEAALWVEASPYRDYLAFQAEVASLIANGAVPGCLLDACARMVALDLAIHPVLLLRNCPIGDVPYLDLADERQSKHERKTSFIAEALLEVISVLTGKPIITYRTANGGDMFHDVHPVRALEYSLSQKTLTTLSFHSDLPENKVRPDWVHLLALRNSAKNRVYNSFVRNQDLYSELDPQVLETLRSDLFYSPIAKVTKGISIYDENEAGFHHCAPVIIKSASGESLNYNQDYIRSKSEEGRAALAELAKATDRVRCSFFLQERDLVGISNNHCLHARHVVEIGDLEAHRNRWLLKTWNTDSLGACEEHFVPGRYRTVDE